MYLITNALTSDLPLTPGYDLENTQGRAGAERMREIEAERKGQSCLGFLRDKLCIFVP